MDGRFNAQHKLAAELLFAEWLRSPVGRLREVKLMDHLQRVIEKPDQETFRSLGSRVYLSMNCWRFSSRIFDACRRIKPSIRGEYEVPDAVQFSIDLLEQRYRVVPSDQPVLDLSSRSDVAPIAAILGAKRVEL